MNCPNKICKLEIPDDSCFCDQCGVHLLRCDKCGFIGTSKFCGKCGGPMSAIQPPASDASPSPSTPVKETPPTPPPSAPSPSTPLPSAPPAGATVIVQLPSEKIFLCHPDGWKMEIADGNILGRTNGPHSSALGKFPVISSNHAKVTRTNNEWFITDLNSTNKTYVNGAKLEPNVPVKIKQNDVVTLANVTFTVRLT
ncbi:hypothetical protein R84B8_03217 [Treponema sp. R8-4-B8]